MARLGLCPMRLRSLTQKAATVLFGQITDWSLMAFGSLS